MTDHFTGVVIVEKVTPAKDTERDQYGMVTADSKPRTAVEVAKVVVCADTLDILREKITAHLALID